MWREERGWRVCLLLQLPQHPQRSTCPLHQLRLWVRQHFSRHAAARESLPPAFLRCHRICRQPGQLQVSIRCPLASSPPALLPQVLSSLCRRKTSPLINLSSFTAQLQHQPQLLSQPLTPCLHISRSLACTYNHTHSMRPMRTTPRPLAPAGSPAPPASADSECTSASAWRTSLLMDSVDRKGWCSTLER